MPMCFPLCGHGRGRLRRAARRLACHRAVPLRSLLPSAASGPTFRCGVFLFVALALADSSSARLTTCKPQNASASYRSITNRHQPPTICSTNKSLLNTKKGFAERTSPRLFSENSMPNQARLKLDYGADEIAYPPTTEGRSREIRLSRSDQVARRATRGALRSKVARGRAGVMRGADLPRGSGGGVSAQCDATEKKTEATRFRRVAILPRGSKALAKCERPRNRCRRRLFRRSFAAYSRQN